MVENTRKRYIIFIITILFKDNKFLPCQKERDFFIFKIYSTCTCFPSIKGNLL